MRPLRVFGFVRIGQERYCVHAVRDSYPGEFESACGGRYRFAILVSAGGWAKARSIAQDESGIVDVDEYSACADGTRVPS